MITRCFATLSLALAAACSVAPDATASTAVASAPAAAAVTLVRGATRGANGFATITDAPPAPFIPVQPTPPAPPPPEQVAGQARLMHAGRFQNEVRNEVQALAATLRAREPANFVDLYYDNEGEPTVVFRFLREPGKTLAKYTRHPRFRAQTGHYMRGELRAVSDFMMRAFREDRVIQSMDIGNIENRAVVRISVPEPKFRALAARKRVTIPEAVKLEFTVERPASAVNAPLPPAIARLVRIFPRDDRPTGIVNDINSTVRIALRDGCFRATDQGGALVLFALGARLFVDHDGYLSFGEETSGYARVGETVVFHGSVGEVTAPALVDPIHSACGAGQVIKVNALRSAATEHAQAAVTVNDNTLREFRTSYGLSATAAKRALERCKVRAVSNFCPISPPAPPAHPTNCPAGTRLSFGICRSPEGYIRPLPAWLRELSAE